MCQLGVNHIARFATGQERVRKGQVVCASGSSGEQFHAARLLFSWPRVRRAISISAASELLSRMV